MAICTNQICKIKSQENVVDRHNFDDNDGGDAAVILASKIYIL